MFSRNVWRFKKNCEIFGKFGKASEFFKQICTIEIFAEIFRKIAFAVFVKMATKLFTQSVWELFRL